YAVLALAALTRPEPALLLAPLLALRLGYRWRAGNRPRQLLSEAPRLAWFALPYGAFLLWRIGYYGQLLPNTYYAKVYADPNTLTRGWQYLTGAARELAWGWPAAFAGLALLAARLRVPYRVLATSIVALTLLAIVWWEGGDWMPAWRTLVPVLPLCALLAHEVWRACNRWKPSHLILGPAPAWIAPPAWVD